MARLLNISSSALLLFSITACAMMSDRDSRREGKTSDRTQSEYSQRSSDSESGRARYAPRTVEDRGISDEELRRNVLNSLQDEQSKIRDLDVSVSRGVVTLSGNAPDHYVVDSALARVLNTEGVRDIDSEIKYPEGKIKSKQARERERTQRTSDEQSQS